MTTMMHDNASAFARMIVDEEIQQQETNRTISVDQRHATDERFVLPPEMRTRNDDDTRVFDFH